VLGEANWLSVRSTPYEVAILPWGATEAHNYHLPYGTDTIQAEAVAIEAARLAWNAGARVVVLPAIPFGVNTTQLDIPLTLNLNPTTQLRLLEDLVASLSGQGLCKLVLLNGHGGNDFKPLIRELVPRYPMLICQVNWYQAVRADDFFTEPGDHAGQLETSALLHLAPHLVRPRDEAGDGALHPFRITALREGWAWTPRRWTQATEDTGVGNPAGADAARGAAFIEAASRKIADFLVELAAADAEHLHMSAGQETEGS
jgi:creatinine amidohydrolase